MYEHFISKKKNESDVFEILNKLVFLIFYNTFKQSFKKQSIMKTEKKYVYIIFLKDINISHPIGWPKIDVYQPNFFINVP